MAQPLTRDYALTEDLKEKLQQLVPEAFEDGQLNTDTLRELLGEKVTDSPADEHFGLNWVGKRNARRIAAQPFTGTLKPCPGEGINEDQTENIFIEGENLEVLKILRKSYAGRIKMIYIDPPYNTGNDFIYKDDFADSTEEYLRKSGQKTGEGLLVSNPKSSGRFHTNWLNFIYPRLRIAKDLLRDDGIIFISIDDAELDNLKFVMNEIFGEENMIASLVYDKNRKNDARFFSVGHEYMLVYLKSKELLTDNDTKFREPKLGIKDAMQLFQELRKEYDDNWEEIQQQWRKHFNALPKKSPEKKLGRYSKIKDDKGPYRDDGNISWPGGGGPMYEVIHPVTKKPCKKPDGGWRYSKAETFQEEVKAGRVVFGPDETTLPRQMRYLFENEGQVMTSVMYSYAQTATMDFVNLMDGNRVFENPKYWSDISRIVRYTTGKEDIILDFFSGSSSTAHAVIKLNQEDSGNRKFICVQLPEACDPKSEAYKAGYATIAEIGKERIRRVIHQQEDQTGLGFKVFKLDSSNIRRWKDIEPKHGAILEAESQMEIQYKAPLVDGTQPQDLVTEVMLVQGFPLTAQQELVTDNITRITHPDVPFTLYVTSAKKLSESLLNTLPLQDTDHFVCLDLAFGNNNSFKQTLSNRCHLETI